VADLIPAASVLLAREPDSAEVFLVQRADNLRFFGGFVAFPGGKVGSEDHQLAARWPSLTGHHVAAVRELFEETGVLLARRMDGSFPPSSGELSGLRQELLDERLSFTDFLDRQQLALRPDDLQWIGILATPAFSAVRFETHFFVATRPAGQDAEVWPGELARGFWASSAEALRQWTAGELLVSPPSVALLETLVRYTRSVRDLPWEVAYLFDPLATGAMPPIWFSPGVLMVPLRCDGLPPSSYTNAYRIGREIQYLIDPGPTDPKEQDQLLDVMERTQSEGEVLAGVILTHHHPDHIGAALRVSKTWRVPILAHAVTAELLRGRIPIDRELRDGETLDLGPAPHGRGRWSLQAFHTPGHDPGHLVFWEATYRLLFAADMVSTLSSIIIAPPKGDLAQYLDSLRLLQRFPARLLLPAHGSPSARPAFLLQEALAHREKREQQLVQALAPGPQSIPELAVELYRGLPAKLMALAELQTLAGLQKLQREERAEPVEGATWRLRSSPS
jgi:endoribonuclease LACTB2